MRLRISRPEDFFSGVLFIAVVILFLWAGWDLRTGTGVRMGPGYFPRIICVVLATIGIVLIVQGLTRAGEPLGRWNLRVIATLLGSVVLFGLTMRVAGLVLASMMTMALSSAAVPGARWNEALLVSVIMVAACSLLFIYIIGLPFPLWPVFPG